MGMSLEEIVFLFTVSGLPRPPPRSVSASLYICMPAAALGIQAQSVSQSVLRVLSVHRDASLGFVSVCFQVWGLTVCIREWIGVL